MSYWERQLNRRRFMAGVSALGVVASSTLIGCGGSSSKQTNSSDLVTRPKDSSSGAKRGGTYLSRTAVDENNIDPSTTPRGAGLGGPGRGAYSRLLREKEAPGGTAPPEFLGDLAESWESSNGGLQLTVKLRKDAKFDPRAPTTGRNVTADDVLFSFKRLSTQSSYRGQLSNEADPSAPVLALQKVDDYTLNFKLAFPWVPLQATLANGTLFVVPTEGEDKVNLKTETRGSGPWLLNEHQGSAYFKWRKNPNWFRQNEALYLDGYDEPIIVETAAAEAQFRAKRIYNHIPNRSSVLTLTRESPGIQLYQEPISGSRVVFFGLKGNPQFKDVRVRRAISMVVDRELYSRVDQEADLFAAGGIHLDINLDSHVPEYYKSAGLWLDPRGNALGEGAKYFQHDVAEAKKLMAAAGYASGFDAPGPFRSGDAEAEKRESIVAEWIGQIGIRLKLEVVDYQNVWLQSIYVAPPDDKGNWAGLASHHAPLPQFDPGISLYVRYHSRGAFTASRFWDDGQKEIDSIIEGTLREFDENKRKALFREAQRKMAVYMSAVAFGHTTLDYDLVWPWVQNWGFTKSYYDKTGNVPFERVWLDESKMS